MDIFLLFVAGALLCNGIPHLFSGLRGDPFPTPFAKPPGKGDSPPLINFLWGSANLAGGFALLLTRLSVAGTAAGLIALGIGWLVTGGILARHFGSARRRR